MSFASTVVFVIRLALGAVMLVAGVMKVLDPEAFSVSVQGYRLVPFVVAAAIATYLPWVEVVVGIALIAGCQVRGAAASVGLMSVVFLVAIGSAWVRGLDIACGCFGSEASGPVAYPWHMLGNVVMLAASVILMLRWGTREEGVSVSV